MLNLGSLDHHHGLKEAHVVHRLGPDQLGEVKDPFMTFCTASRTGWTPFEAPKTKALGGEEEQTTPFLNRDKENRSSLRSLGLCPKIMRNLGPIRIFLNFSQP